MDSFLFTEDCEAWIHGPVYREIYNHYSGYRFDPIESNTEFDISVFTDAEKAVIDSVIQNFCCYSGKILDKYFTTVKHKYNMLTPNDIENYAQLMFSRSNKS